MAEIDAPAAMQPQARQRYQYSMGHLLGLIAGMALLLGAWRALGAWTLCAPLVAAVAILPAIWQPRWLYVWLLPLVWTGVAWANFYHPGDEYGGFVVGSLAGVWIALVVKMTGSPNNMLPPLLMAGATTVALAGLMLDLLRVRWQYWSVLMLGAAMLLFAWSFGSYPSVQRALSKNGSIQAYIFPSINLGIYFASIVSIIVTACYRLAGWLRHRSDASA